MMPIRGNKFKLILYIIGKINFVKFEIFSVIQKTLMMVLHYSKTVNRGRERAAW